jgi:GNAT superfamily N-acetyltransferase
MPDMLVKLYTLPPLETVIAQQQAQGIEIRRAIAPEKHIVADWVARHFHPRWASETEIAFANKPNSCYLALEDQRLLGFACHDATYRNFFGPTGVTDAARGRGTGRALLLACLHAMYGLGYAYAIIGAAGPTDFYTRCCGAVVIEDSAPGPYRNMLREMQ